MKNTNKYQEVLNNLVRVSCPRGNSCKECDLREICNSEAKGYVDTLQELVDKATPKKIEIWNGQYSCPNCKKLFFPITSIGLPKKFCDDCGHAIDWSDEHE